MSKQKIIILGGGVAGLSAAHELSERGFPVTVYERQPKIPGGKARSVPVPNTATDGRKDLPGEHGFRFFPGFYKHVTDTMSRIPFNNSTVENNLTDTHTVMMARYGKDEIVLPDDFPSSLDDLKLIIKAFFKSDSGLTEDDISFFSERIWQLMTICRSRRLAEYESIGWWDYLDASNRSKTFQNLFVLGLTRSLVAAKAEEASTKTVGDIFLQLIYIMMNPFVNTDRVLNGPTNEVWIDPWLDYLQNKKGVVYNYGHEIIDLKVTNGKITGAEFKLENGTTSKIVEEAIYICATPIERFSSLINKDLIQLDPTFKAIQTLSKDTNWMNGIQFYLSEYTPINEGHIIYTDSPWALTSISQKQFWPNINLEKYGNGNVKDILSVDISDWNAIGGNGKIAKQCTKEEVMQEVWQQLKKSLNSSEKEVLKDDMLIDWYLDSDIVFKPFEDASNEEPLLINKINSWTLRPEAFTRIPNFYLAADYVRTYTDLATMEGANEAARRAVNAIIDQTNDNSSYCKVWNLHEPFIFSPFRWHDQKRFKKGLPWKSHLPWYIKITLSILKISLKVIRTISKLFK